MLIYLCCISILLFLSPIAQGASNAFDFKQINTLFNFGDSYTTRYLDLDNMQYACANCTSSGGMNWVEYLAGAQPMANWTGLQPMTNWDLAYNSAPVSNFLAGQEKSTVTDITTQITQLFSQHFLNNASQVWDQSKTLYTTWTGINDIGLTWNWTNTNQLDATLMLQYEYLVDFLSRNGAENIMMINVPPIDRAALYSTMSPNNTEIVRLRVNEFNQKLSNLASRLNSSRIKGRVLLFDAWSEFTKILDSPADYGFNNITGYCPGDWSQCEFIERYFWLNDVHPTYKVHQYLAEAMYTWLHNQ